MYKRVCKQSFSLLRWRGAAIYHRQFYPSGKSQFFSTSKNETLVKISDEISELEDIPLSKGKSKKKYDWKETQLEQTTERLLALNVSDLTSANALELTTAIASWHSETTTNKDLEIFSKVKHLLEKLLEVCYLKSTQAELNVDTINKVVDTWRKIANHNAPTKFQSSPSFAFDISNPDSFINEGKHVLYYICEQHEDFAHNDDTFQHPDEKSFNMIMDVLAKFGIPLEAELILDFMSELTKKGQVQCRPSTITYNTLLSAYSNAVRLNKDINHVEKAIDLLENMISLYEDTINPDVKPDVVSFATTIAACSYAAEYYPNYAQRAEDILHMMKEMYESSLFENGGNGEWLNIRPNSVCFSSAIHAWSKSGLPEALDRASSLYNEISDSDFDNENAAATTALLTIYGNGLDNNIKGIGQAEKSLYDMIDKSSENGSKDSIPTVITFTSLMSCLAESASRSVDGDGGESARQAEAMLYKMDDYFAQGHLDLRPSTITFNAIINVWSKTRTPDAGDRAAYWLKEMEERENIEPDLVSYNTVIAAYAKCGQAEEAETILRNLISAAKNGEIEFTPNCVTFAAVIDAHAYNGEPRKAERLLDLMNQIRDEEGWSDLEANDFCLNGIIKAYMKSKDRNKVDKCLTLLQENRQICTEVSYSLVIEGLSKSKRLGQGYIEDTAKRILESMWEQYEKGNKNVMPTSTIYASIINIFAKRQNQRDAVHYLNELLDKYSTLSHHSLKPSAVCYNACLHAFNKASIEEEAKKAEEILDLMINDIYVEPDSFSMTNVISAWANCNNPERAEAILNNMQAIYEEGNQNMKPTTVSFGAVLNAFARTGNATRAKDIVDHMEELQDNEGFEEMKPNSVIYNTLINAFAKSKEDSALENALTVLNKMKNLRENGSTTVAPTTVTYNSILSTCLSTKTGEYDIARKIFQEMELSKLQCDDIAPTTVTYTIFLRILAKANVPKKSFIAEQIMNTMESDGNEKTQPNNFTYDALIKLCGRPSSKDVETRRHCLTLALRTLSKMQEMDHIQPTSFTYGAFLSTVSKLSKGKQFESILKKVFQDCCEDGVLNDSILNLLPRIVKPNVLADILQIDRNRIHGVSTKDLPESWSRNAENKVTKRGQRAVSRSVHNTGRSKIKSKK